MIFDMRTSTKLSALYLTMAIALGMAGQANAMDVGDKGPFAQIEQTLNQEHQVEVARAKYLLESPKGTKELCVKLTVNANGEGYILMSDSMDDSRASFEVVYGKMKDAHAYDPHHLGTIPQGISPQSDLARRMGAAAADGDSVLMHGNSVKKMPDGSESIVGSTTVMAHVSNTGNVAKRNSLAIYLTTTNDVTTPDKVVATDLQFFGIPK